MVLLTAWHQLVYSAGMETTTTKNCVVYLFRCTVGSEVRYKIGVSANPAKRMRQIQTPGKIEMVDQFEHPRAAGLERRLHARYRKQRGRGEWFDLTEADIAEFSSVVEEESNFLKPAPEVMEADDSHYDPAIDFLYDCPGASDWSISLPKPFKEPSREFIAAAIHVIRAARKKRRESTGNK